MSSSYIKGLDRSFRSAFFYVFRGLDTRIPSVGLLQCRRVLLLVDVWDWRTTWTDVRHSDLQNNRRVPVGLIIYCLYLMVYVIWFYLPSEYWQDLA